MSGGIGKQVRIGGVTYSVVKRTPYVANGRARVALRLVRPNGRRAYLAFLYEDGSLSKVVA